MLLPIAYRDVNIFTYQTLSHPVRRYSRGEPVLDKAIRRARPDLPCACEARQHQGQRLVSAPSAPLQSRVLLRRTEAGTGRHAWRCNLHCGANLPPISLLLLWPPPLLLLLLLLLLFVDMLLLLASCICYLLPHATSASNAERPKYGLVLRIQRVRWFGQRQPRRADTEGPTAAFDVTDPSLQSGARPHNLHFACPRSRHVVVVDCTLRCGRVTRRGDGDSHGDDEDFFSRALVARCSPRTAAPAVADTTQGRIPGCERGC
ncbi:hypothetical protein EDC01DRAFT_176306 [Geopyxis carbonaria]|nr:hypothetical protein EDC01DRAFT_176306 [Geopyxis carbonaria]